VALILLVERNQLYFFTAANDSIDIIYIQLGVNRPTHDLLPTSLLNSYTCKTTITDASLDNGLVLFIIVLSETTQVIDSHKLVAKLGALVPLDTVDAVEWCVFINVRHCFPVVNRFL